MNDHHDEKKPPIEEEDDWFFDETIHNLVNALDKLQERCEALESLVRDMRDLIATPAWDRGRWTTDGRCFDFDARMAELGIEVNE